MKKNMAAMRGTSIALAALLAASSLVLNMSCATSRPNSEPSLADLKKWPYKQASTYSADVAASLSVPVPQRIGVAPKALLDYWRQADGNQAYAPYSPSATERKLFADYFELLPGRIREVMQTKLLGVYFIENLAGGGISDFVFDGDGALLVTLVLNPKVLSVGLSDWIAYRDSSPYKDDGAGVVLESTCTGDYKGLAHTLAHESAHIYDYFVHATPYVERHLASATAPEAKDFTKGVWIAYSSPAARYSIPRLSELAPYGLGAQVPLSLAAEQYAALAKTPFSSMYGAASWAEDFAESVAWAWLGQKLGVSYRVIVMSGSKEKIRFAPDLGASDARRETVSIALQ